MESFIQWTKEIVQRLQHMPSKHLTADAGRQSLTPGKLLNITIFSLGVSQGMALKSLSTVTQKIPDMFTAVPLHELQVWLLGDPQAFWALLKSHPPKKLIQQPQETYSFRIFSVVYYLPVTRVSPNAKKEVFLEKLQYSDKLTIVMTFPSSWKTPLNWSYRWENEIFQILHIFPKQGILFRSDVVLEV